MSVFVLPDAAFAQASREDKRGTQDAINAIGENATNQELIELLAGRRGRRSPNKYVRAVAAQWLGERYATEGNDALYAALDDGEPYVQRRAALAYANVIGCDIEPRLFERFSASNATTRAVSIAAVRHLLVTCINSKEMQTRQLLETGASLLEDRDAEVRAEAVHLISLFRNEIWLTKRDQLIANALSDSSPKVRLEAVRALKGTKSIEAVRRLQPLLEDESDRVQKEVIGVLVSSGLPEALRRVRDMLGHQRTDFRIAAIRAISELGDPRYAVDVAEVLGDYNPRVRREAVRTVAKLGAPETSEWLLPVLEDRDPSVRLATVLAFKQLCLKDSNEAAQALALVTADFKTEIAETAVEALRCMRNKEIVPELIQALCRASNLKTRKQIVQLLENTTHDQPTNGIDCRNWRDWLETDGNAWTHE